MGESMGANAASISSIKKSLTPLFVEYGTLSKRVEAEVLKEAVLLYEQPG